MTDQERSNLLALDAIATEVALDDAEHGPTTPALAADVEFLMGLVRSQLAEARRRELARAPVARPAPARPSLLAMTRDALVARLDALRVLHPNTVVAHRDFAVMTDADLRTAVEDAETALGRAG